MERYCDLYEDMVADNNQSQRKIFGDAEKWAFHQILEVNPEIAEEWVKRLEASGWFNYITAEEFDRLNSGLVNQDGSKSGHWTLAEITDVVGRMNKNMECEPFYNKYALALTMNMLYSDHKNSASSFVQDSALPTFFYHQAVEKLKDRDREYFIRPYFEL